MARAGDGKPRSNRRRATALVSLRLTPPAKADLQRRASAAGYSRLAPWIHDRLRGPAGSDPRRDIVISGKIGQIGGVLSDLARNCDGLPPEDIRQTLHTLGKALAHVQMLLLERKDPP